MQQRHFTIGDPLEEVKPQVEQPGIHRKGPLKQSTFVRPELGQNRKGEKLLKREEGNAVATAGEVFRAGERCAHRLAIFLFESFPR